MDMDNKKRVIQIVDEIAPDLRELTLKIHDNPEIGMTEVKACAWQVELLQKYGFTVETGCCANLPTSYRAVYKSAKPGPVIAFLAEYDALPTVGHGCGHNLIALVGCGCGITARTFADEYGGEIRVYGTPAEENGGGKVHMTNAGLFDDCDAILMAHPSDTNMDSMNTLALKNFGIEFFGKPAHAAGCPEAGINALDAIINFFNLVNGLRQQTKPDARMHGIITHGGVAPNVIPDYTRAEFYVRSPRMSEVNELAKRVEKCAEGAALGTGCTYKMQLLTIPLKDTQSNLTLSNLAADHLDEFLEEKVQRTDCALNPASSDLGDVSYKAPSIQMRFKIGNSAGHTHEFAQDACSEYGIQSGLNFVKGLTLTAIDLLSKPEILAAVKKEHLEKFSA